MQSAPSSPVYFVAMVSIHLLRQILPDEICRIIMKPFAIDDLLAAIGERTSTASVPPMSEAIATDFARRWVSRANSVQRPLGRRPGTQRRRT